MSNTDRQELQGTTRVETDSLGEIQVPAEHYWGAQTQRSLHFFPYLTLVSIKTLVSMKWRVILQIIWDYCLNTKFKILLLVHSKLANLCLLVCKSLTFVRPICDRFWIVILGIAFYKLLTVYWLFIPTFFIMMLDDCPCS